MFAVDNWRTIGTVILFKLGAKMRPVFRLLPLMIEIELRQSYLRPKEDDQLVAFLALDGVAEKCANHWKPIKNRKTGACPSLVILNETTEDHGRAVGS